MRVERHPGARYGLAVGTEHAARDGDAALEPEFLLVRPVRCVDRGLASDETVLRHHEQFRVGARRIEAAERELAERVRERAALGLVPARDARSLDRRTLLVDDAAAQAELRREHELARDGLVRCNALELQVQGRESARHDVDLARLAR